MRVEVSSAIDRPGNFESLLATLEQKLTPEADKPAETPLATMESLLATARQQVLCSEDLGSALERLVAARLRGVPLAHITGRQSFMGIEFLAGPEALIPRMETEILCRGALEQLRGIVAAQGSAKVIDLCCGSGNIGLVLAAKEPNCTVYGADISPACISLADRNCKRLGLQSRALFIASDLFVAFDMPEFKERVDLITCNPPYISSNRVEDIRSSVARHEPVEAFDGGPLGVSVLMRLIREAPRYLRPAGVLAFEVGAGQARSVTRLLNGSGEYADFELFMDGAGIARAIIARKR